MKQEDPSVPGAMLRAALPAQLILSWCVEADIPPPSNHHHGQHHHHRAGSYLRCGISASVTDRRSLALALTEPSTLPKPES